MLNIVIPSCFILFSCVFLAAAQKIPGAGKWDIVGSRFVPQWLLIILLCLSIALFIQGVLEYRKKADRGTGDSAEAWFRKYKDILLVYLLLFLWICSYDFLGFFAGAFLLMFFLQWWLENKKFRLFQIIIPFASSLVCYFVFCRLLNVAFPFGVLENLM